VKLYPSRPLDRYADFVGAIPLSLMKELHA